MNNLDITIVVFYLLALLAVGLYVSFTHKQKKSSDLFLAGKSLTWKTVGLSIFGTNVSPLNIISTCGLAYTYGMVACNFQWLAWIYILLLSLVFLPYYLRHNIQTMPQFMLRRYDESCRKALSWIVFLQISIGAGSVLYAGSMLVSQLIGFPIWQCVILMTAFAMSFTVTGGLKAVAITDSFQSVVMVFVCVFIGYVALTDVSDWSLFTQKLDVDYWKLLRPSDDPNYPWQAIVFGYPIMSIWYWCANQNIVQTTLGSKNLEEGNKGILFLGYLKLLIPVLFILPGILAKVLLQDLENPDDALLRLIYQYLPHGLVGLAIGVLIAALVGSLTAMYNSGSTIFALDILPNFTKSDAPPTLAQGRMVMATLAVLAMLIAIGLDRVEGFNLFEKVNAIFSFLCPSLVAVFIWGIFWKKISSKAALYTLIAGNIPCILISILYLSQYPSREFYPNFFLISFYLFAALSVLLIVLSYRYPDTDGKPRPIFEKTQWNENPFSRSLKWGWGILAVIMIALYSYFN